MTERINMTKVLIGGVLTILWICVFLFINPNNQATSILKTTAILLGLVVLFGYNLLYRSSVETTKLSWTTSFTISWLALILFFPFKTTNAGGAIGFFALVGGLAACVLWIRFFSDEII